ncbi:conserved hypothetical protein [Dehalogenimonas lykanthroporepellens BL-DC-9]|nr:conserved hypothetical protein [Dehalogenimonas lykanthroporepellens BL-DC-9]
MRNLVLSLCACLLLVSSTSGITSAATIVESYTPVYAPVNSTKASRPSEMVAMYPMSAAAEDEIVHIVPEVPVNIDGTWYKAEDITLFNGHRLHLTVDLAGALFAFTDVFAMETFIENEYGPVFDLAGDIAMTGTGESYGMIYEDWLFGGKDKEIPAYELHNDLTLIGWNDCISSVKAGYLAPITLWEHINKGGDSLTIMPGTEHPALTFAGFNDRASCITDWAD